jgi:uncharacterized protein (DUF58 family)
MSLLTSFSSPEMPDHHKLWAEASAIADTVATWPRQARTSLAFGGQHPKRQAGAGSDFWQYRALHPGEAVSQVDWRKSARNDSLLVRDHEREVPARLFVWCDQSPSMQYRSVANLPTKADWAYVLTATLALAATQGGEQVTTAPVAGQGSGLLRGINRLRDQLPFMTAAPAPHVIPEKSLVIITSDFLGTDAWLASLVRHTLATQSRLLCLHVHDPAEAEFPFDGRVEFSGLEGEDKRDVDDATVARQAYLEAWSAFTSDLDLTIQKNDNQILRFSTASSVSTAAHDIIRTLRRD